MSKLYFRYGAMNCGKSTHLLQVAHNYEERDQSVLIMKPAIDTKGDAKIVSRLGSERSVDILIRKEDSVLALLGDYKPGCILVDEAQFLTPEQVEEFYYITKVFDIPVICYGLRCDFQMQGFTGSPKLLLLADSIEEMKTICRCGKKATQNLRLINGIPVFDGEQTSIDDGKNNQTYESVCGKCYLQIRSRTRK